MKAFKQQPQKIYNKKNSHFSKNKNVWGAHTVDMMGPSTGVHASKAHHQSQFLKETN